MARPKGNAPAREKVEHVHLTKSGLARQHIQELILSGAVREGQHLTAREVCEAVGISETPVREAIRGLAAEGWLELNAHHGVVVATLRAEHIAEIHALRGALAALAVELGAVPGADLCARSPGAGGDGARASARCGGGVGGRRRPHR